MPSAYLPIPPAVEAAKDMGPVLISNSSHHVQPQQQQQQAAAAAQSETFLLIKPDASTHHTAILQRVGDLGHAIIMQSFVLTKEQAETVVHTYPSMIAAQAARSSRIAPTRGATSSYYRSTTGPSTPAGEGGILAPHNTDVDSSEVSSSHRRLVAEIFKLARRTDGNSSVARGDDSAAAGGATAASPGARQASAADHVDHLVQGTCLALLVSGLHVVPSMVQLCGPEDPKQARETAPNSLRAVFGTDPIRNAVHTAANAEEASRLVELLFGRERRLEMAQRRMAGPHTYAASLNDVVHPPLEAILPTSSDTRDSTFTTGTGKLLDPEDPDVDPLGGGGLLDAMLGQGSIRLHRGGATRPRQLDGTGEAPSLDMAGGGGGGGAMSVQMAQMLADEKRRLMTQSKHLRLRELDLLLREQELYRIVAAANPTTAPPPLTAASSAAFSTVESAVILSKGAKPPTPPPTTLTTSSVAPRNVSNLRSDPPPPLYPSSKGLQVITNKDSTPILIEQHEVDAYISDPRRVGALFHRLDPRHEGVVSLTALLQLYARSSCLHLVGSEDHMAVAEKRIRTALKGQSELNVDQFGAMLMRMLQW